MISTTHRRSATNVEVVSHLIKTGSQNAMRIRLNYSLQLSVS